MEIDKSCFKVFHPFSLICAGVSQGGKTELIKRFLLNVNDIVEPIPTRIIISYTENQQAYEELRQSNLNIEFRKGLDFEIEEFNNEGNTIIVIDDQMENVVNSKKIQTFFTRGVHHSSVSLILLQQNLYPQGKSGRDIRLNSHYIIVMRSPTFAAQIMYLGRQLFPTHPSFLPDAYKKATVAPYSYLFLNLHPKCSDSIRVLQGIIPGEEKIVYLPK